MKLENPMTNNNNLFYLLLGILIVLNLSFSPKEQVKQTVAKSFVAAFSTNGLAKDIINDINLSSKYGWSVQSITRIGDEQDRYVIVVYVK